MLAPLTERCRPFANPPASLPCRPRTMLQVELLLTFEEYCAEEGDFAGEQGALFAELFPQVRYWLRCRLCLPRSCFL